jgi:hypothetical protein
VQIDLMRFESAVDLGIELSCVILPDRFVHRMIPKYQPTPWWNSFPVSRRV